MVEFGLYSKYGAVRNHGWHLNNRRVCFDLSFKKKTLGVI